MMRIRPATTADLTMIRGLNDAWMHVTSPLDEAELARLHALAAYHRVCEIDGEVVAFLLAFGPGIDYASSNYRWFSDRPGDFLYIDRVVVSTTRHKAGIGRALYADVFAFARGAGYRRIVCEVDVEPMNAASDAFHAGMGFVEVGTQWVAGGAKQVSLREHRLDRV